MRNRTDQSLPPHLQLQMTCCFSVLFGSSSLLNSGGGRRTSPDFSTSFCPRPSGAAAFEICRDHLSCGFSGVLDLWRVLVASSGLCASSSSCRVSSTFSQLCLAQGSPPSSIGGLACRDAFLSIFPHNALTFQDMQTFLYAFCHRPPVLRELHLELNILLQFQ